MKHSILYAVIVVAAMFGLYSCQSDNSVTSPSNDTQSTVNGIFSDTYSIPAEVSDFFLYNEGSIDDEISLSFSLDGVKDTTKVKDSTRIGDKKGPGKGGKGPGKGDKDPGKGDKKPDVKGGGMIIGKVLLKLRGTLTEEQKLLIHEAMSDHKDCMKSVMEPIKIQRDAIIADANAQRKAIIALMKEGTIDAATAKAQIAELNAATKAALELIQPDQTALCNCLYALLDAIGGNEALGITGILNTEEQMTIWNEWLAGLTGLCFPRTTV